MPLQLSDIADDPDLGQAISVLRSTGRFIAGGWQSGAPVTVPLFGILMPASDEALQQVPEGDRVVGSLQFICSSQLYETKAERNGVSDKVMWRSSTYRVVSVAPWGDNGYWSAILVRTDGK